MNCKKICKAILIPPLFVQIPLIPIAVVLLVLSFTRFGSDSVLSYISYAISFYTLVVWCVKIPRIVSYFKKIKSENKYARKWFSDDGFRLNVTLYGSLIWNTAYAVLQLALGFNYKSFWYYSLAGYYVCLALMRFFLLKHMKNYKMREQIEKEYKKYRTCGIVFLIMNLEITVMIFFMVYYDKTFIHHEITVIAMATYTFVTMTDAIVNLVKSRKNGSPVYTASKAIVLTSACVSMLTLEATMLTTFSDGTTTLFFRRAMLGSSGAVVSAFIVSMAIYIIIKSNKNLKKVEEQKNG